MRNQYQIKALFITHNSEFYGANKSMLQLIIELRDNYNINPIVILPKGGSQSLTKELIKHDIYFLVENFLLWIYEDYNPLKEFVKNSLNKIYFYQIYKTIKDLEIDLIHTNTSVTNLGGFLSSKLKIPHIWHIREFGKEDYNIQFSCGFDKASKFMNDHANKIICISKALSKKYLNSSINPNKIKVIYNGLLVPDLNTISIEKFKDLSIINICLIGYLSSEKGQIDLIKAINQLIKDDDTLKNKLKVHFLGEGKENYIRELRELIKNNGLEEIFKFHGFVENVNLFLSRMHIGVVTSKAEAFGRVTIEYMLNRLIVIASDSGANKEIIRNGENGFIYQNQNILDLVDILKKVLKFDGDHFISTTDKSSKFAKDNFSSEKNSTLIYQIYKEVLSE
ncbi:glycosyltransferase family 4 protein [Flammeovirga agarivorans]|uniref:Glycosyltransferase family 4 protein n=1 Tax=Flammeovirga agarivorans TaxID=2726742 RepID=A0A7X8SMR9_9BACT|nr:glycosyltransferase family 4 protein [Flammeovirga agarivorans]NLR93088.1 glycosyltransferase family 4 protein [Flammeovirga agarivorans]